MLKRLFILCFLCFTTVVNCAQYWQQEETRILHAAKLANRPIIAIFLGAQDCPWSQKLREEVLENPQFCERVASEGILWQVALMGEERDKKLREKYRVQVSPLILLLDPRGKEFARMEYVPLDAEGYAAEISTLIENFQELCLVLENEESPFEEGKWQDLYRKAKKFSVPYFKQVVLERGLQNEKGAFFHLEKYGALIEKHKLKNPQVLKVKKQLLERDPDNRLGTHFKVAVLEFNKMQSKLKQKDRQEKPLKPLFKFLHQFGKTDKENLWKAELMIAEYLFTKNFIPQALEHAKASYKAAPDTAKPKIIETIAFMSKE